MRCSPLRVRAVDEPTHAIDEVSQSPSVARHDGNAGGQGLLDDEGPSLPMTRENEDRRSPEPGRRIILGPHQLQRRTGPPRLLAQPVGEAGFPTTGDHPDARWARVTCGVRRRC